LYRRIPLEFYAFSMTSTINGSIDSVTSQVASLHLEPYAADVATRDFLKQVLHNGGEFAVEHAKLVRRIGPSQASREAAIGAVIEFACDINLNPMGDSCKTDHCSELCAKALQQFLVRYHGLAESSPFGTFLFQKLTARLDSSTNNVNLQTPSYALQVLRFCILVCVTIPGHDPVFLSRCIKAIEGLLKLAERDVKSQKAQDLLSQCLHILSQHAFILSQDVGDELFGHVRKSLTEHRYPPGNLTDMALQTLENQAVRKYMDTIQSEDVPSFYDLMTSGLDEMDEEMQEDYERFLAENE
jgi:hypothetical protein